MSDPHGFVAEHFPRLYLWLMDLRTEAHFMALGMVASRDTVNPADWLKIIVGVIASAWVSAYATGERTAAELKQYAIAQAEFRQEVKEYMRNQEVKVEVMRDRLTRIEVTAYPNGHASQQGMSMAGKVPK
jgi:hypothetical protein